MRAFPLRSAPAVLLLALAATGSVAAKDDPLAGRVAGKPVTCIDLTSTRNVNIVDEHTILYSGTGRQIWRTGPTGSCPALRPLATIAVQVYGAQLCRNDMFRVFEPGTVIPSGVCRFTEFTPYTRAPKK
jgi:hypothetical protein